MILQVKSFWSIIFFVTVLGLFSCKKETDDIEDLLIKDGSGNIYTEMTIGSQLWLKEDLMTDKYYDGTPISSASFENKNLSGYYYSLSLNFYKVCPKGYKVASKSDFENLINYFGGTDLNLDQIVNTYVKVWRGNPNGNGDGMMNQGSGLYWTSTKGPLGNYYFYFRSLYLAGISTENYTSIGSFHIRCIKDNQ